MTDNIINLAVLGSTGSIGQQTLDIVRNNPDKFRIICLGGGKNTGLLYKQINEFHPAYFYSLENIGRPVTCKSISL